MASLSQRAIAWLLALVAVLASLALWLTDPLPLQNLRNQWFDQYQRWSPRTYEPAPVRVVVIDDASLAKLGQWPWPRTRIAELVSRLRDSGAAAVGFDVVFAEPDRTSPAAMGAAWGLSGPLREQLNHLPDHDQVLAQALPGASVVLGFVPERQPSTSATALARPFRYVFSGGEPATITHWLHGFDSAILPRPELMAQTDGLGALTFVPDNDGIVRRVPLALRLDDQPVPSLSAETLRVGQGARNHVLRAAEDGAPGLRDVRVGDVVVPTTAQGEMWVHYTPPAAERYLPAWQVIAGEVPRDQLEGHLVLVGASAQGLMDLRFNPLGRLMPGVEAHANALEQMLLEHHLQRPGWARALEALVLALGGAAICLVAMHTRALVSAAFAGLLITGVLAGGWVAYSQHLLLLNAATPAIAFLLLFVVASGIHHFASERQQRFVKEAFSHYVSPNLVDHLVKHPGQLELGGQRQTCSFIFTDLQGFTSLMEKLDPAQAVSLLNAYLDEVIAIAFRYNGTLDRIVGDAVAIMFSAPLPQPDHPQRALTCALEMEAWANRYAADLQAKGIAFGYTRLGVHSGEVIVGNFGGSTIFDYRALGDPVNTAARLESVNKHLGTRMCVSEATLDGCTPEQRARMRPVGRLVLKGKSEALMVFEPVLTDQAEGRAPQADYEAAYALLEGDGALERFESLAGAYPADPLVQLHLKRLRAGETGSRIVLTEK